MSFFTGSQGKFQQQPTLGPEQRGLYQQLLNSGQMQGAGGAFGQSADYYRNLLSDNPTDFQSFAAPEMRRFQQETIPSLSEQFAGMGSGGLSSSGFRNAAVNAGADLSERLAMLRSQLRQQGAQGLQGIGSQGLGNFNENVYMQGQPGLFGSIGQGLGNAFGQSAFGSPNIGSLSSSLSSLFGGRR